MNKNKSYGNLIIAFFIFAMMLFSNQFSKVLSALIDTSVTVSENSTETEESTIDTDLELEKQFLDDIASRLNIDRHKISKIGKTDYISYETTSDEDYINTLELLKNNSECNISDNGIKRYTWYIIFKIGSNTNE